MQKTMYYAAHKEGQFFTPRQALTATGAASDVIDAALSQAKRDAVILDFGGYLALTTPSSDGLSGWVLWRAFIRDGSANPSDVRKFIDQFPDDLRHGWAIFEYTDEAPPTH